MTEDLEEAEVASATEAIPLDKLVAIHAKIKARQAKLDKEIADLEEQRDGGTWEGDRNLRNGERRSSEGRKQPHNADRHSGERVRRADIPPHPSGGSWRKELLGDVSDESRSRRCSEFDATFAAQAKARIVRCDEHRTPRRARRVENGAHIGNAGIVEPSGRFVGDEKFGGGREGKHEGKASTLAI